MIYIIGLILWLIFSANLYFIFKKAGKDATKAFIPFVRLKVWLEITGRPTKWFIPLCIPIVAQVMAIGMLVDTANCFGRGKFYEHILATVFWPFYFIFVGTKEEYSYLGPVTELPKVKKSVAREWGDAILFAVVAATFIRWATFEAYTIPTPSMEKSLLVGDFLFVSKMHYGPRTPRTPLQVPLTHKYLPFTSDATGSTGAQSYLDWIQLPSLRLPGLSEVTRNDVVVFNYPEEDCPTDVKTNYIKRCVAVAGDKLEIKDQQLYINGEIGINPTEREQSYRLYLKTSIVWPKFRSEDAYNKFNERLKSKMLKLGITDNVYPDNSGALIVNTTLQNAEELMKNPSIDKIVLNKSDEPDPGVIPNSSVMKWNKDNMGPVWIPKAGETIELTPLNIALYEKVIRRFEYNDEVEIKGKELWINGVKADNYTFKQNYYFMMGDNRHNSLDSRFWGFVPADHVVGKAMFIWLSLDANESGFSKIRWKRMFSMIK